MRDFCSLPVRAHRCRTVSLFVHWKLVSYRFLALIRRQCCPFFWGLLQMRWCFICLSKSGLKTKRKRFVERQRAKKTIDGGSHADELHWWTFVNLQCAIFVPHRSAKPLPKSFSSFFDISSIGFENLVPRGLASHSVTLGEKVVLLRNLHECEKSRCSYFTVKVRKLGNLTDTYRWIFSFRNLRPFHCYWDGIVRRLLFLL